MTQSTADCADRLVSVCVPMCVSISICVSMILVSLKRIPDLRFQLRHVQGATSEASDCWWLRKGI